MKKEQEKSSDKTSLCPFNPKANVPIVHRMSHKVRTGFNAYSQELQQAGKKNHQREKNIPQIWKSAN